MNQSENIRSIESFLHDLQDFYTLIENDKALSAIEIDLIKQKTRTFYDTLRHLKINESTEDNTNWKNVADEEVVSQPAEKVINPVTKPTESLQSAQNIENDELHEETKVEEIIPDKNATNLTERKPLVTAPVSKTSQEKNVASSFDLFSEPAAESIGESLAKTEHPAVAEKLQKIQIADLREAIGINDKFVFINELFHGDMGKYNKTLDELNSLSSLKGVQTFLMELSVQYQWNEENPAFVKLSEIIERKFA